MIRTTTHDSGFVASVLRSADQKRPQTVTPPSPLASSVSNNIKTIGEFLRAAPLNRVDHIDDHDLERYHLGMIQDEGELAPLEEHLLACPECAERAEVAGYAAAMGGGIYLG